MKRLTTAAVLAATALTVTACGGSSSSAGSTAAARESGAQNQDSFNLVNDQPVPVFTHSQIRQELIDIEQAQADGVQTTTFFMPNGAQSSDPEGSCPSIGAPVAADDELTNPQKIVNAYSSGVSSAVINQMDPNGIYTGNSTGTYIMCVDSAGKTYAQYWEGPVRTIFGPATWNTATHEPQLVGPTTGNFSNVKSGG